MDFGWEPELEQFRDEVSVWIREYSTPELQAEIDTFFEKGLGPLQRQLRAELDRRGWRKLSMPVEYGGAGKSSFYRYMLHELLTQEFGSQVIDLNTGSMAPAIERFGTEEQKRKWLPGLWSGDLEFAIAYSEPQAGTDLVALELRAVRDGDEWVFNGCKSPVIRGGICTHIWMPARTDLNVPRHKGMSMFVVPVDRPGISMRPVPTMANPTVATSYEVFFEDYRAPADCLIGQEGQGWYLAMNALNHERETVAVFMTLVGQFERLLDHLKTRRPDILDDRCVRSSLAQLKVDLNVVRALKTNCACAVARDEGGIEVEASMAKVFASELAYRTSNLAIDILGRYGVTNKDSGDLAPMGGLSEYYYRGVPPMRFAAGTNEIQRALIAERGLGFPRETGARKSG